MREVGVFEAKTHLARLLQEVAEGETIVITRHGTPVAQLVPPSGFRKRSPEEVIRDLNEFREREKITLGGLSLREMIEEGRH